jgi:hypothetical protein
MVFDVKKSLFVLVTLSMGVLFSSISIPQSNAILLGQISTDAFINNRAVVAVADCTSPNARTVDAVQVEGDQTHFTVRRIGLHDGFGSSEDIYLKKGENKKQAIVLEQPTCVAKLEVLGSYPATQASKRSMIRIWGLVH